MKRKSTIILGIDPGLGTTGWGLIQADGNRLSHIAHGEITTQSQTSLALRLAQLQNALAKIVTAYDPDSAACEEVFVNKNPKSTLKLAQARGALITALGQADVPLTEYSPRLVKKAIVGTGGADKVQVQSMVGVLLPGMGGCGPDAADALAVAITHAHHDRG